MNIRLELSSLASKHRSGVAEYTRLLSESLSSTEGVTTYGHFFDFLYRQPKPGFTHAPSHIEANHLLPLRVYAKAQSLGFAPAFDIFLPKVDLTIFPNFATWPTIKSKLSATAIHDLTYLYFPDVVEEKNLTHLRRVVPRSIKKADFILTVSESVKRELVKEFNINPSTCIVTPIPPDQSFFSSASDEQIQNVKKKYNISFQKKYIYFLGNFEPRKNLKTLIEAYQLLPEAIKNEYSLILAGGNGWKTEDTKKSLETAVKNGADIHHIGFIDQADSPVLYQAASLFVMPSLYEGFGIPVTESLASGCPVVASDIPVLREVGENVITYADPLSPDSFAKTITQSLSAPRPSRESLQKQVLKYSWDENVAKIINYTESLL